MQIAVVVNRVGVLRDRHNNTDRVDHQLAVHDLERNICLYLGIKIAILKENSPSCGPNKIYDGSFSHKLINGQGVTAELLRKKGIKVISEDEIDTLLTD